MVGMVREREAAVRFRWWMNDCCLDCFFLVIGTVAGWLGGLFGQ